MSDRRMPPELTQELLDRERIQILHGTIAVFWVAMLIAAIVELSLGSAAENQTFDSGALDAQAQAGIDYLIAGFLGLGCVLTLVIQLAVVLVQTAVRVAVRETTAPPSQTASEPVEPGTALATTDDGGPS